MYMTNHNIQQANLDLIALETKHQTEHLIAARGRGGGLALWSRLS